MASSWTSDSAQWTKSKVKGGKDLTLLEALPWRRQGLWQMQGRFGKGCLPFWLHLSHQEQQSGDQIPPTWRAGLFFSHPGSCKLGARAPGTSAQPPVTELWVGAVELRLCQALMVTEISFRLLSGVPPSGDARVQGSLVSVTAAAAVV